MRPFNDNPVGRLLWRAIDAIGEMTTIPSTWVKPIFSVALFPSDVSLSVRRPMLNIHAVIFGYSSRYLDTTRWHEEEKANPYFRSYLTNLLAAMPKFNTHGDSLYYNAPIFIRIAFPFFIGIHIRWSGATNKKAFLQTHIGWKLNGRFAIAFRVQSDQTAERGMDFPNPGQAKGWEYAGK